MSTTIDGVFPAVEAPGEGGAAPPVPVPSGRRSHWWVRPGRPAWGLPAHVCVTALAALLYGWGLGSVGMGNSFYAAAVKSGTESWKAFLFGSLDPGNFITVDKPPASLWLMELSGRLFGFSSWSMLVPEALCGVVTVAVLYHLVRRWAGELAGLLAALAMALTPIAVVMFRYNNPDALLTLLLVLSAWALWSALETAKTWKLVACGALLGLAFTTKSLQAFVVLPALAIVYLCAGAPHLRRRIVQVLWAGLALMVSSGWWVALVELWPTGSRPYVGGSTNNSELNLIFGYNGFGRLLGSSGPGGGGGPSGGGGPGFGGSAGPLRMFNDLVGGQVSWLVPLALAGLVAGLWLTRRGRRTDLSRAGYLLWGGWLLCTAAVFSMTQGIFHPYYTVALAPGVAALAGAGSVALWRLARANRWWSFVLPAAVVGSAVWAAALLGRTPGYAPGLAPAVLAVAGVAAAGIWAVLFFRLDGRRMPWLGVGAGLLAAVALLAGPTAYSVTSIQDGSSGGLVSAGPRTAGFPAGGFAGVGRAGGPAALGAGPGGFSAPTGVGVGFSGRGRLAGREATVPTGLVRYLEAHRHGAQYLLAVSGSQAAAPFIISTGQAVMAMGGFNGSDPWPTLAAFKSMVASGRVRYVLVGATAGGAVGFPAGPSAGSRFPGGFGGQFAAGRFPGGGLPGGPPPGGFPGRAGGALGVGAGRSAAGGGGPAGRGTVSSVERWVQSHGQVVASSAYGGGSGGGILYDVPPSAARS